MKVSPWGQVKNTKVGNNTSVTASNVKPDLLSFADGTVALAFDQPNVFLSLFMYLCNFMAAFHVNNCVIVIQCIVCIVCSDFVLPPTTTVVIPTDLYCIFHPS